MKCAIKGLCAAPQSVCFRNGWTVTVDVRSMFGPATRPLELIICIYIAIFQIYYYKFHICVIFSPSGSVAGSAMNYYFYYTINVHVSAGMKVLCN